MNGGSFDKNALISLLFDLAAQIENYAFVHKSVQGSTTVYLAQASKDDVARIFSYLNEQLVLDPMGSASVKPVVFGEYNAAAIKPDQTKLTVTIENGELSSVELTANGTFVTSFPDSGNYSGEQTADYTLRYTWNVRKDGESFVPFDRAKDAK